VVLAVGKHLVVVWVRDEVEMGRCRSRAKDR